MKRLSIILLVVFTAASSIYSQTAEDALRYSRLLYGGTARFQGLGGAMGAVGADFSVAATNPAGLGLYKSSELTISPAFFTGTTLSDFYNVSSRDSKFNMGLANLGYVLTKDITNKKHPNGLKSVTIAFGMSRQNDFNNRIYLEGQNNRSSMLTDYVNILNNNNEDPAVVGDKYPFDIGLAYNPNNNGLIYYNDSTKRYYNDAPNGGVYQQKSVTTKGSMTELNISLGLNLNDKLYLGATIGVPSIHYTETSEYRETKTDTNITYFQNLKYDQYLETRGTGMNLKIGIIYRPANWVRIGAAIHTPTYYPNMRDSWYSTMYANFDNNQFDVRSSPDGYFNYEMSTPFRAIGSIAFFVGPYGLISGEYEYANYNQARFYSGSESFKDVNTEITNNYTAPLNFRVGTEWRISNFRIRGGFAYNGKPYTSSLYNGEKFTASGGFGYRGKVVFSDIAFVWSQTKDNYYLYDPTLVDPSANTSNTYNAVLTFGVRF